MSKPASESFERIISVPYIFSDPLDISPFGFLSQILCGHISPVQVPGAGVFDKGINHCSFGANSGLVRSLLIAGHHAGVGFLVTLSLPLLSSQCGPFIFCCGRAVQLAFRLFPEGVVPYVVVDFLCSWVFLCCHLGPPPHQRFLTDEFSSAKKSHHEQSWVLYGKDFGTETSWANTRRQNKSEWIHNL